jgi:hypothetical protein
MEAVKNNSPYECAFSLGGRAAATVFVADDQCDLTIYLPTGKSHERHVLLSGVDYLVRLRRVCELAIEHIPSDAVAAAIEAMPDEYRG